MLIQVLKSKLNVRVTSARKDCEGSITIDPFLMKKAGLYAYERVEVNGKNTKSRIVTYVIPGDGEMGQIELNGGAANFFKPGDQVHINCFAIIDHAERYDVKVVNTNEQNIPI